VRRSFAQRSTFSLSLSGGDECYFIHGRSLKYLSSDGTTREAWTAEERKRYGMLIDEVMFVFVYFKKLVLLLTFIVGLYVVI
jgi:hypothetical protein